MEAFMYNKITNWLSKTNKPRESLYLLKFIYWLFRLSAHPHHPTICSRIHHQSGFVEIAVINRLHCLICRFRALWGDHGMLTLTLNLLLLQNEVLWIVEIKWKKHDGKFAVVSHSTALKHDITMSSVIWRPSFLKYEAWKMPSSACFMEVISCIHYNFEALPCSTTLQLVTIVELNDIFMHSHVYVVVNFYLGQFLFFFCLWAW